MTRKKDNALAKFKTQALSLVQGPCLYYHGGKYALSFRERKVFSNFKIKRAQKNLSARYEGPSTIKVCRSSPTFTKDKKCVSERHEGLLTSWNKQSQEWTEQEGSNAPSSAKSRWTEYTFLWDRISHSALYRKVCIADRLEPEAWACYNLGQVQTSCRYM